ncbi:MAG: hypothetical protein UX39_C0002G0031 [Candidatus Magasanikbacteria bacterium GW2011_GWA2_46_17]|uniref:Uncharacterized protein n=1 Tax=Candidatus Magasanikbacteria bacterium GW2011_GWA2_46_17 TaxID=1619042 RepID=A0A0G1P3T5_9BACT|nr:MAG: hypothetical protein UX39_C0002G0031 [Candidatus Magasanikbacteria bacterium GW2011_GWA2_46_17]
MRIMFSVIIAATTFTSCLLTNMPDTATREDTHTAVESWHAMASGLDAVLKKLDKNRPQDEWFIMTPSGTHKGTQDVFLEQHRWAYFRDLEHLDTKPVVCVGDSANKVNACMRQASASITLPPFPTAIGAFGVGSVFQMDMSWKTPGEAQEHQYGVEQDATISLVSMYFTEGAGMTYYHARAANSSIEIVCVEAQNGYEACMTDGVGYGNMLTNHTAFKMTDFAIHLMRERQARQPKQYAGATFPMMDVTSTGGVSWVEGLEFKAPESSNARIAVAVQEIHYKMDELGANLKAAVATTLVPKGGSPMLQIGYGGRPIFLWVMANNSKRGRFKHLERPLFVGLISQEHWKRPKR